MPRVPGTTPTTPPLTPVFAGIPTEAANSPEPSYRPLPASGLVDRVYGHLGDVRHRSEVVEFRVEQHREELGERLSTLPTA